jgi:hypothetical protein
VLTDTSTRETEQLRLWASGDTLVYEAHPSSQARAEFRVLPATATELVFANPEHDFPQRIIYRRVGNDSLIARIEGDRAGRMQPITYPFKRRDCGATGSTSGATVRAALQAKYDSLARTEAQTPGSRLLWFADHAARGYAFTVWSITGSSVISFDASSMRQTGEQQRNSFRTLRPTDVKFRATVERVRVRGDSVEALVSSAFSYKTVDSAGRMGPPGATHERAVATKWFDHWLREGSAYSLRRTDIISEEISVDGRLTIRDGRPVPR